jgi:hypothetical protein
MEQPQPEAEHAPLQSFTLLKKYEDRFDAELDGNTLNAHGFQNSILPPPGPQPHKGPAELYVKPEKIAEAKKLLGI